MKPVFCNTFNISHNKNKSEITISFAHVYTERNFSMKDGALTNVSAQVVDDVANVLLTRDGAMALTNLLNRIINGENVE